MNPTDYLLKEIKTQLSCLPKEEREKFKKEWELFINSKDMGDVFSAIDRMLEIFQNSGLDDGWLVRFFVHILAG